MPSSHDTLILWSYTFGALLFGALALDQARGGDGRRRRRPALTAALVLTALWALAMAGIGGQDVSVRIAEGLRNVAWLIVMLRMVWRRRTSGPALYSVYLMTIALAAIGMGCSIAQTAPFPPSSIAALESTRLAIRMMLTVSGLILAYHLQSEAAATVRSHARLLSLALSAMWGSDLVLAFVASTGGGWPDTLVGARGIIMIAAALLLGIATRRRSGDGIGLSRTVVLRMLAGGAAIVYLGTTALLTTLADGFAGSYARTVQVGIVVGASASLLTLLSTPWLRAWTRVMIAKHFFHHRYDYRTEWQRFSGTLGRQGDEVSLETRVVEALADIVHAPSGLLLIVEGETLDVGAGWHWPDAVGESAGADLARHLATSGRIVELDRVRSGDAPPAEIDSVPAWMSAFADCWALVPLIHGETLVAAVLLTRPPVDRALDWEDFDLLRVAGRQAASYLAEERAHRALADASRFDEFNRRFAFIMHDIKNLVSQLTLVARNAERHADNPDFRMDMIATLNESAGRMTLLLARLSQHSGQRAEPFQSVDVAALLTRTVHRRRLQHPMTLTLSDTPLVTAQVGRLEQVLGHLVQNAIDASAPDAAVTLAATGLGTRVAIDVTDTGSGMTSAFVRDRLFRPFVSCKPGGFGIGAFEARQLVHAMGGTLEVTSREGEGSRFRILLPVSPALEAAA